MHEIIRMKLDFRCLLPRDRLVTLLVYSIALFVLIINDQPHSQNIYSTGCHAHLDVAVSWSNYLWFGYNNWYFFRGNNNWYVIRGNNNSYFIGGNFVNISIEIEMISNDSETLIRSFPDFKIFVFLLEFDSKDRIFIPSRSGGLSRCCTNKYVIRKWRARSIYSLLIIFFFFWFLKILFN